MKYIDEYTKPIDTFLQAFEQDIKEAADAVNKVYSNVRLSEIGKQEARKEILAALEKNAKTYTERIKEAAQDFYNDYSVAMPEDNKDHSAEVANALKVIDMLGEKLTPEILKGVLDPLKTSFKNLKLISDIITAKVDNVAIPPHIAEEILLVVAQYADTGNGFMDYINYLIDIKDIVDDPNGLRYRVNGYSNSILWNIYEEIPYSYRNLTHIMQLATDLRYKLERNRPDIFTDPTPTATQQVENTLSGQIN